MIGNDDDEDEDEDNVLALSERKAGAEMQQIVDMWMYGYVDGSWTNNWMTGCQERKRTWDGVTRTRTRTMDGKA